MMPCQGIQQSNQSVLTIALRRWSIARARSALLAYVSGPRCINCRSRSADICGADNPAEGNTAFGQPSGRG